MRNWDSKDELGFCLADEDAEIAELTCRKLDIPFTQVNFVKGYWNEGFEYNTCVLVWKKGKLYNKH